MKALFYTDWCTIRATLLRIYFICGFVAVPVALMGSETGSDAPGIFAAAMLTVMPLFYCMLGLFGADEQQGWEQVRLALPVTTDSVVRARYAFIALAGLLAALVGATVGILFNLVLSTMGGFAAPRDVPMVVGTALAAAVVGLAYLALFMPVAFRMGVSSGRVFFVVPFMLPLLFNIGPVRAVFSGMAGQLEQLTKALGTPAPLIAAGLCLCVLAYLASMRVAERLYAARDF